MRPLVVLLFLFACAECSSYFSSNDLDEEVSLSTSLPSSDSIWESSSSSSSESSSSSSSSESSSSSSTSWHSLRTCVKDPFHGGYEGRYRKYYFKAEKVEWDYAPYDRNMMMGTDWTDIELAFVGNVNEPDNCRIGRKYLKAMYVAYTDETYTTRVHHASSLGLQGPVIRALVGDVIHLHVRNSLDFPITVHPHGVQYTKENEGAPTNDLSDAIGDDGIPPGGSFRYEWMVTEASGPGPADGSSVNWGYHSHVNSPMDTNTGLFGPLVVALPECANWHTAKPLDVDAEFFVNYAIIDENLSHYLDENIAHYCSAFTGDVEALKEDEEFEESNLMHGMNGLIYGNLPGLVFTQGDRVRWNIWGLGSEPDIHTPHWHGNTVLVDQHRQDTMEILPLSFRVADMVADAVGTWQTHCHVNDHITAGMKALYTVLPNDGDRHPELIVVPSNES